MNYRDKLNQCQEEMPEDIPEKKRFEIPKVKTKKAGNKTVIQNFRKIAKKLGREKKHISKFLLKELGTAGHIKDDELILKGHFRRGTINAKLKKYCEKYVLCSECKRPDTKLKKEKNVLIRVCEACGARENVEK